MCDITVICVRSPAPPHLRCIHTRCTATTTPATTARPFGTRPLGAGPLRARATVWHAPERGDAVVRGHRRAVVRGHGRADMRAHRLSDRWQQSRQRSSIQKRSSIERHAIRNPQSRAMAGTSGRRLSGTGEGGVSDLQDRRRKGEVRRRSKRSVACPLQATSSRARRRRHQHGGRGSGARERTSPSRLRWRPVFLATSLLALLLCTSAARARRRGIPTAGGGCTGTGRDGR